MKTAPKLSTLQDSSSDFDQLLDNAEQQRKVQLLKTLSLVMLWLQGVMIIAYPLVGFIIGQPVMYLGIIPTFIAFIGFAYSAKLPSPDLYNLGCWVIIGSESLDIVFHFWCGGTEVPLVIFGFVLIALSLVLMDTRTAIIVTTVFLVFSVSIYFAQSIFKLFSPLLIMSSELKAVLSIIIIVVVIPPTVALMIIPHASQIKAVKNLREALNELELRKKSTQQASEQALNLASQLHSTASQQASGSQQQASSLTQVTSFMQEMSQTAFSIAEKTTLLARATNEIKLTSENVQNTISDVVQTGEKGGKAVKRTIESSIRVSELYTSLKQTLDELEQRQGQIKEAVTILQDISNETHLLSLNAAIEAAGAGQYGERFGVVASEVRSLADRSRLSSEEVRRKLGEIEERIQTAADKVEDGFEEAQKALLVAQESGIVMSELVDNINRNAAEVARIEMLAADITEQAREINYATNQQSSASNQATETLREIGAVALQIATGSIQVTNNAGGLERLSENLIRTLVA